MAIKLIVSEQHIEKAILADGLFIVEAPPVCGYLRSKRVAVFRFWEGAVFDLSNVGSHCNSLPASGVMSQLSVRLDITLLTRASMGFASPTVYPPEIVLFSRLAKTMFIAADARQKIYDGEDASQAMKDAVDVVWPHPIKMSTRCPKIWFGCFANRIAE